MLPLRELSRVGSARVGASTAAIFFNLVPVFAVVMAITLLAESLTLFQLIGMGLIFIGIGLTIKPVALVPHRIRRYFHGNLGGIGVRPGA